MSAALRLGALAAAAALAAGCATQSPPPASKPAAAQPAAAAPVTSVAELYAVFPPAGRLVVFGDRKVYFDYLAHGEVALTRTRIGAAPGGQTLVFGITNADVKANAPSVGELAYDGKLPAATPFYGEVVKNGRYYIFGEMKDMKDFIEFGEVAYGFTDIGVGPRGETLVYVMNKASIQGGKPMDRVQRFKAIRVASR
ncbi:MAG: hypothetical protein KJZ81_03005 [Burkholderiaceae bacterium]|nr:hypothetical protein [Burkholderiaceae bacterium]